MNASSARVVAVAIMALTIGACGDDDDDDNLPNDEVTTRSSPSADFTSFHTFRFVNANDVSPDAAAVIPSDVSTNITAANEAMRQELLALGLTEVAATETPDLFAFSLASTDNQAALSWSCIDGYWYGYWSFAWDPCAWLEPTVTSFSTGSIVVGVADPVRREIVYGGLIRGVLDGSGNVDERIDRDVEEAFADYPSDQTGQ